MKLLHIPTPRKVLDRAALADDLATLVAEHGGAGARPHIVALLRTALDGGRAELARRLAERPSAGHEITRGHAWLIDQLIRTVYDHVVADVYPVANRTAGERLTLIAVGGYGRAEMAPHSDVDLACITPGGGRGSGAPWCEQVIEALLYFLWDLGLKVGHSSRSLDEMVRMARADLTIRTALLEGRYLWGDEDLYAEASRRFWAEVVPGSETRFVTEKLAERAARHKRMGDSRYVVEPNVKDGKGGLRDLQTLYWIGKYLHRVGSAAELVDVGLFSPPEYRSFRRAEGFLLAVRCHLHTITGRAEDRLTFDQQREVAARMRFADRPGKSSVERFMQFYFLQARHVGHLTGVFLAHFDEGTAPRRPSRLLAALRRDGRQRADGYTLVNGRIAAPDDGWFQADPVRLLEIYCIAEKEGLEIHPATTRMILRDAALIKGEMRRDPRANALFLQVLAGRNDPETVLRWMNEAGVFGRFVRDFGRVGAQMQFDMYHHYTVDEHTIRAIGLVSRIERRELVEDHPLATQLIGRLTHRRVLYVATLLHDIAKGRDGDHSVLGAEIALRLCPRLGLDEVETQLVSWLVLHHLLMSHTAFKRDLTDPKTITDFIEVVQDAERLRQLLVLTVVDIRAVGPGIWNSWKRQLLGDLHTLAEERMRGAPGKPGGQRVAAKQARVTELLGDEADVLEEIGDRFDDNYWIAEPEDIIALNLPHYAEAKRLDHALSIHAHYYPARGATLVTVIGDDHPGLFFRIAGAIHLAGGNVIDARIHTTRMGKAVDNFLVQDPLGCPFRESYQLQRLEQAIRDALAGRIDLLPQLARRPLAHPRADSFHVHPQVSWDHAASDRFTVLEVSAADRPALLNRLARVLFEELLMVNSAHITHYGERAVDTFYVTDLTGAKLRNPERLAKIEKALLKAASQSVPA